MIAFVRFRSRWFENIQRVRFFVDVLCFRGNIRLPKWNNKRQKVENAIKKSFIAAKLSPISCGENQAHRYIRIQFMLTEKWWRAQGSRSHDSWNSNRTACCGEKGRCYPTRQTNRHTFGWSLERNRGSLHLLISGLILDEINSRKRNMATAKLSFIVFSIVLTFKSAIRG